MDQEDSSESLAQSAPFSPKKLSAEAPEFVPRSSAVAPPSKSVQRVYARPPTFVPPLPPPYYGYDNYYQQNTVPFYGYNVSPVSPVELGTDRNNGGAATVGAASTNNGLPDAHLKILNQVEFYFSDINLATTDQLFKYMSKDPEGYVPLSVVASFKKIKTAISSNTQLVTILQSSQKLLVSEDGKKVKRQNPLSESDMEELQSRIVVAENLPEDHSHQNLMKIFSSVGSVKSIRTCPPQNSNNGTTSVSKTGKGDAMHLSAKFHAYVEYESIELAEKAVVELTDEGNWRNSLKVRLLLKPAVKPTQVRTKKVGNEGRKDETTTTDMQCLKENHLEDPIPQSDSQFHDQQWEDNGSSNTQRRGRNYNGNGNGNGKTKGKGKGQKQGQGRGGRVMNGGSSSEYPVLEASESSEKQLGVSRTNPVPRMPDGTKGFSMGRGKPLAVKTA